MTKIKEVLEVEIRQNTEDVPTNDPDVTDVNVIRNTFREDVFDGVTNIRVYIQDDHDEAIDVDIEHTHTEDDDFSNVSKNTTISLTSGADVGNTTLDGPLGKIRANILASDLGAAPTSGSMFVEIIGTN